MKKKVMYKAPELKTIVVNIESNLLEGSDQHQGPQGDDPAAKIDDDSEWWY